MLKICNKFSELDFDRLLKVYDLDTYEQNSLAIELYDYLHQVFFRDKDAFYALWKIESNYVSALRMEPYQDGYLITAVQTTKSERRKGYAECLLRAVVSSLQILGNCPIYVHIHKKNVASIQLHMKCGFTITADHAVFIDGTASAGSYTLRWIM